MDGVIAEWCLPFAKLLADTHGSDLLPPNWESSHPEWVTCWDWPTHYGYPKAVIDAARARAYADQYFWYRLPALPETETVLRNLQDLVNYDEIDLYFITHRSGVQSKRASEMWLYDKGIVSPTVLVTDDKVPVLKGLKIEWYIDDRLETIQDANQAGLTGMYLLDRPWNREGRADGTQVAYTIQEALQESGLWIANTETV